MTDNGGGLTMFRSQREYGGPVWPDQQPPWRREWCTEQVYGRPAAPPRSATQERLDDLQRRIEQLESEK
jgi:hypothetical protein